MVRRWLVGIGALAVVTVLLAYRFWPSNPRIDDGDLLENLQAIGYIEHVETDPFPERAGVTVYDADAAVPGGNLYSVVGGSDILLLDMRGALLHEWSSSTFDRGGYWRLAADGNLYGIGFWWGGRLASLDWESNVRWQARGRYHHDLFVAADGRIFALREEPRTVPSGDTTVEIRDNLLVVLSPAGEQQRAVSMFDLFGDRVPAERLRALEGEATPEERDLFHANTVEPITRDIGVARAGQILTCLRHLDLVAVVDIERERVVWAWGPGELDWPHKPVLLDNDNVLIFDNGKHRGFSRLVEVDPRRNEVVWQYRADPPESFFSSTRGSVQTLPGGNILVTESNKGRAFELTRSGRTVWEFWNPLRDDEGRRRPIYRMTRVPLEQLETLLPPE